MQTLKIERANSQGSVASTIGVIVVGMVILFVGLFMLGTLDTMFEGRVQECSDYSYSGSGTVTLNATAGSGSTTANISFTSIANQRGSCGLYLNVSNVSATAGTYLEARDAGSLALLKNITVPATYDQYGITGVTDQDSGNWIVNVSAFGGDSVSVVDSATYLKCCKELVYKETPAGQTYPGLVSTTGTIFSVMGLVLIIIGLATALSSLKGVM